MTIPPYDLDVRPILEAGGEPFGIIMQAVAALAPGQGLRLFAPFKPVPLFQVLGARGFEASAREIGGGDWEVVFSPVSREVLEAEVRTADRTPEWHEPAFELDCRDLDPPEPMVKALEAVEKLKPGQTVAVLVPREPLFLFEELRARGHRWRGSAEPDGSYRIVVRACVE